MTQVISRPQTGKTLPDGIMATLFGMAYNFAPASSPAPFFTSLHHTSLRKHLHFIGIWWFATKWSQAHVDWTHTLQQQAMVNHCCISFLNLYLSYVENPVMSLLTHAYALQESEPTQWHEKTTTYPAFQKLKQLGGLNVSHFCHTLYPCLVYPFWSLCLKHPSSSLHSQSLDLDWSITPFLSPQTDFT